MSHHPTPWELEREHADCFSHASGHYTEPVEYLTVWMGDLDFAHVHGENQEANAAFIVRAVNAHDDMLEALKEAVEPLRLYQAYGWPDRGGVIRKLQAIIAKAERSE